MTLSTSLPPHSHWLLKTDSCLPLKASSTCWCLEAGAELVPEVRGGVTQIPQTCFHSPDLTVNAEWQSPASLSLLVLTWAKGLLLPLAVGPLVCHWACFRCAFDSLRPTK